MKLYYFLKKLLRKKWQIDALKNNALLIYSLIFLKMYLKNLI